jgi:hypothetical protein
VASPDGVAVDDPDVVSVRASVCAYASVHAAMVSTAIRVRLFISLWRQVAVKPISLSERYQKGLRETAVAGKRCKSIVCVANCHFVNYAAKRSFCR